MSVQAAIRDRKGGLDLRSIGEFELMRVLHVFKTYLPETFGGIERVIWELAEGTSKFGVKNHVFHLSAATTDRPIRIDHHWSHAARRHLQVASTPVSACAISKFRSLARQVDIIHYHFPWPFMDYLHLISNLNTPAIATYHSDIIKQKMLMRLYRPVMGSFLGSVDRIIATSSQYVESSDVLALYREKTAVIPIGITARKIINIDKTREEYWRIRLPKRFFLYIGVPRYYKGLNFLMEAAALSGYPVVIAGAGQMPRNIEAAAPPNVTFLGEVSSEDKDIILSLCESFVFPSHLRSEAFGIALVEASFAGKAMISCELGTGTSYVNMHGVTGLVVPPGDAKAISLAMRTLWENPEMANNMGKNAADRASELFDADNMASSYFKCYLDIINKIPEDRAEQPLR